jgi:hypothetical protein
MFPVESKDNTGILMQFKSIKSVEEQITFVLGLLYTLDSKDSDVFHTEILNLEELLEDTELMRAIRYRDSIVESFASEYFGRDYGEDDVFKFEKELEEFLLKTTRKLLAILGRYLRVTGEVRIDLGDET